jgi:prepilin-type N-terminal cleavage/methylation domain-containing protein
MDKKGVTLVELLIVVSIIGILAMIAVPGFIGQGKKAARQEAYSNLQNLRLLLEQYYAENGCYYREGGPPPVCTNKADILYKGTYGTADGGIEDFLPGFKPGDLASLNFAYKVTTSGATAASAFVATATGKTGSKVYGDTFTIDQNNTRNF